MIPIIIIAIFYANPQISVPIVAIRKQIIYAFFLPALSVKNEKINVPRNLKNFIVIP